MSLRKLLSDQGFDAGAHTIAYHLAKAYDRVPSVATIWRILVRRGFVTPQPQTAQELLRQGGELLRELTLDPNRDYQRQA